MSFFIRNVKGNKPVKRKREFIKDGNKGRLKTKKKVDASNSFMNEEISSDSDLSTSDREIDRDDDEQTETAQEKKLKLAKKYLEEIEREEKERLESNAVVNGDVLANRLKEDALTLAGKLRKQVAQKLRAVSEDSIHVLRNKCHNLPVTCVAVSANGKFIYSASKDGSIVKWSLPDKNKLNSIASGLKSKDKNGHKGIISALAVSHDGKYLVSGDVKNVLKVWNAETLEFIRNFDGHKGSVTGVAICKETNHLYSSSGDRSVKVWNLEEMMYVETLFGHQSSVTSVDVLCKDRVVSSGGTDNSVRVWKIPEESQLIYNGSGRTIDDVTRLDDSHYASCGEDGLLCVWGILKKKALCAVKDAHGLDSITGLPNWIVSVSALPFSDLLASGSSDGYVRLWKISDNYRKIEPLFGVKVTGFVNSMVFTSDEKYLILGVGQEHKMGRWSRIKEAKNSVVIIELNKKL